MESIGDARSFISDRFLKANQWTITN
jgi:hypothetical protein